MHEKVQEFINEKKNEERRIYDSKKSQLLISLGLTEKVYSDSKEYSYEFPYSENVDGELKWYKIKAIEITDEEYEEIKKYSSKNNYVEAPNNTIATILTVIAWIVYIAGFLAGMCLANVEVTRGYYYTHTETEFSIGIALMYWGIALVSGTLFLGFAEIIKLLQGIKDK